MCKKKQIHVVNTPHKHMYAIIPFCLRRNEDGDTSMTPFITFSPKGSMLRPLCNLRFWSVKNFIFKSMISSLDVSSIRGGISLSASLSSATSVLSNPTEQNLLSKSTVKVSDSSVVERNTDHTSLRNIDSKNLGLAESGKMLMFTS